MARQCVEVVEVGDTLRRYAVDVWGQIQLGHDPALRACQRCDDNRADASAAGSRVRTSTGRSPPGVAANQTSPRCISPLRPILGRAPVRYLGECLFVGGERVLRPCVDVGSRAEANELPVQGLAKELGTTDSQSIRPTPNISCFIVINSETEHCHTFTIRRMTRMLRAVDPTTQESGMRSCVVSIAGMKIAFPTRDDQTIPGHFGHMKALIVVEVVDGEEISRERRDMSDMPECGDGHQERPAFVVNVIKDCDVLIAGGIGAPLVQRANAVDVDVVLTDTPSINDALARYLAGTLDHNPELAHHHH